MKKQKSKFLLPIVALIVANTFWGLNTVFMKISLETIPPVISVGARFTIAALCMLPFALRNWRPMKTKYLLLFMLSSIFGITLSSLSLNMGLHQVPAFNAAVIWLTSPILLVILSASLLKEKISTRTFIGIAIAIAGSMIVIGRPDGGSAQSSLAGNLFILLSVIFDCISVLMIKPLLKRATSLQVTVLSFLPGSLPVLIYALFRHGAWSIASVSRSSAIAFGISTLSIIIANILFFYALRHRQAHTVGIYGYLDPALTVAGAWFILGERPAPIFAVGAGLIIVGLWFTELKKAHHYLGHHRHHR